MPARLPALLDHAASLRPGRREFLKTASALAAGLALPSYPAQAATAESWCATWGTAPAGPPTASQMQSFSNQTLRLIVCTSIGGKRVRVRLSNTYGTTPLAIGAVWIGLSSANATLVAGSNRQLSFDGKPGAVIPAGAPLLSDPLDMALQPGAILAVSIYLPGNIQATTVHDAAFQTSYASTAGNYASATSMPVQRSTWYWPFLSEIDVVASGSSAGATLIAIGDSQTDGMLSTNNANHRWPDYLARRLQTPAYSGTVPVGVVNRGIAGNCLLLDNPASPLSGHDCMERFDRDVAATAGARWLAVLIGINDILNTSSPDQALVNSMADGYVQLVSRARARGMPTLGATLLPWQGYTWYSAARESVRQSVNSWIRTSGAFDAVADFDAALRDPSQPTRMLPSLDGGDHLHPNDAGYQAMANAVPMGFFSMS